MERIQPWDPRLDTGHPVIDAQHRELLEAIHALHTALRKGEGKEGLAKVLGFLRDYTSVHFREEEALMSRHAYPDQLRHTHSHSELVAQVDVLLDQLRAGTQVLSFTVIGFLKTWLTDHIRGEDFHLAEYLRRQNPDTQG